MKEKKVEDNNNKKKNKIIIIVIVILLVLNVSFIYWVYSSENDNSYDKNISERENTKKENNIEEQTSSAKPYVSTDDNFKWYSILQITGVNKSASIQFYEDGTCSPSFYSLNNCSSTSEFCVFYQRTNTDCTYTEENNIISVDWDGIYELQYSYKDGLGQSYNSVIENGYIMKGIQFQYFPDGDYIDTINGKWKLEQGDGYYKAKFVAN